MVEEFIRKQIELDEEVHQELMVFKLRNGYRSANEAVKELLAKNKGEE